MVAGFLSAWLRMLLWNPRCWWQFDTGTQARVVLNKVVLNFLVKVCISRCLL